MFMISLSISTVGNLSSTRSKLGREDIKWQELLAHFRLVQGRHEKARRQALGTDTTPFAGFSINERPPANPPPPAATSTPVLRPPIRRKVTGEPARPPSRTSGVLSPLNPKARSGLLASSLANAHAPTSPTLPGQAQGKQPPRTLTLNRKS